MPDLLRYRPRLEGASDPCVWVTTPEGATMRVDSEELRHELEVRSGIPLYLMRDHRGNYDIAPVSIIAWQTIVRIAEGSGTVPEPRRFRPNLLVDLSDGRASGEMAWVGRVLRLGDHARVAVTAPDKRCAMITFESDTSDASPQILRWVVQQHGGTTGVHGTVLTPGDVRVGDPIVLEA
ncbi:MAG TPA: MOSC domain-containing protein [bacterium]|nr:MOSC domain-containing protein [bacterium]